MYMMSAEMPVACPSGNKLSVFLRLYHISLIIFISGTKEHARGINISCNALYQQEKAEILKL